MTQFEIFAGNNRSTQFHQVAVADEGGEIHGERAFAHSGDGLAEMVGWILGHGSESKAGAAIEKPHGPEVDALLERGVAVLAPRPKQFDCFSPAGAKDDRRDALVLVGSLAAENTRADQKGDSRRLNWLTAKKTKTGNFTLALTVLPLRADLLLLAECRRGILRQAGPPRRISND